MIAFVRHNFIPATLAFIVFMVSLPFIETVTRIYNRTQPAVEWYGGRVVTPSVKPSDVLSMVYTARVHKQCPADIRAFIVAADGSSPVRFPTVSGGYTEPTSAPTDIKVNITIPARADEGLAPLTTGDYIYRSIVTRYCEDGIEYDHNVPDIKFHLEVP